MDTQYNCIHNNNTQHNVSKHIDTQHDVIRHVNFSYYTECHIFYSCAEYHYAKCHSAKCHSAIFIVFVRKASKSLHVGFQDQQAPNLGANVRLGCKGPRRTNTLAYLHGYSVTKKFSFF